MRTLQQIYDFCLSDRTYNEYYHIPGPFECKSREQYRYYHTNLGRRGQSRSGTYIFHQSQKQLFRFLGIKHDRDAGNLRFFLDKNTYELANNQDYEYPDDLIYIRCCICKKGVLIEFSHPFNRVDDIIYCGRSHQPYTEEGVRRDVINYINKHLLYPPGRYRDLQVEHQIYKKDFVKWYKNEYLPEVKAREKREYLNMLDEYAPQEPELDWDECYGLLQGFGIFSDFGCDDFEKDEMTDQFYFLCNP